MSLMKALQKNILKVLMLHVPLYAVMLQVFDIVL